MPGMRSTESHQSTAGPADAPAVSLADLQVWIEASSGLAARDRRDCRAAIRALCAMLGSDAAATPADAAELDRRLARVPKPARGRADKTVANIRWRLRRAIALHGGETGPAPRDTALTPHWAALRERLPTRRLRYGLSRLIREASAAGVEPQMVSDALLEAIAGRLAASAGEARARAFRRQAAECWNEAAGLVAGWPRLRLASPARPARPSQLPLDAFPITFRRDLERYLAWAAHSGRLSRDGSSRSLSPSTVRLRGEHLRLAASALARRLGYPRRVISLATLVEPVNFKLLLGEYLGPGGERQAGTFARGLAVTLFGVARQWVKAPASQLDQLGHYKRRLGGGVAPRRAGSDRLALERFADPATLAALRTLPERLFAEAAGGRSLQPRAVRKAQLAVALALLLTAPLRLGQLAGLRLGHELRRPSGRHGPMSLVAGDAAAAPECAIVGPAKAIVDDYLDHCHAALLPNPEAWLFLRSDGSRWGEAALRHGIAAETRRAIGIASTPGRLRQLAAANTGRSMTVCQPTGRGTMPTRIEPTGPGPIGMEPAQAQAQRSGAGRRDTEGPPDAHDSQRAERDALLAGLCAPQARIAPKYLYDSLGSALFDAITELDEYYPTRTERAILRTHEREIAAAFGRAGCTLIDLGAGNGEKAASLFPVLRPREYVALDISVDYLQRSLEALQRRFPQIVMTAIGADLARPLVLPARLAREGRLFFYPGSSIGNLTPDEARRFLAGLCAALDETGGLLIGIDLLKDPATLQAAYDDPLGVTAAFNLNVLRRANRIAGTDFAPADWRHVAYFEPAHGRIEMHLEACRALRVSWPGGERRFAAGERIHTENSYKYRLGEFAALLADAGFALQAHWSDEREWFAVLLARPQSQRTGQANSSTVPVSTPAR